MVLVRIGIIFIIITIAIAQLLTPGEYSWKVNTISQLASQTYRFKYIMQVGFIGFGLLVSSGLIIEMVRSKTLHFVYVPIIIYALAILVTGIFCEGPFISGVTYNMTEAKIHSLFAMTAGIALSLSVLLYMITASTNGMRLTHLSYLIFITGVSILFGLNPSYQGLIQRILYLGSFSWLYLFLDQ